MTTAVAAPKSPRVRALLGCLGWLLIAAALIAATAARFTLLTTGGMRGGEAMRTLSIGLIAAAVAAYLGALYLMSRDSTARRSTWMIGGLLGALSLTVLVFFIGTNMMAMSGRSPQKRTMADMRSIALALEARATDLNEYPSSRSIDDIAELLEPTYAKRMPRQDGWGYPFRYENAGQKYRLGSSGRSGQWERQRLFEYPLAATTHFGADIIFGNGEFLQYPEGVQIQ